MSEPRLLSATPPHIIREVWLQDVRCLRPGTCNWSAGSHYCSTRTLTALPLVRFLFRHVFFFYGAARAARVKRRMPASPLPLPTTYAAIPPPPSCRHHRAPAAHGQATTAADAPVLAPPRLRDPARANARAGSTYPAMRVYSTCPRVESPARPPQFQGTRGFVLQCAPRPACLGAVPRRPSCCSTSSYSYLRGGAVVVDSARRRGGTDVSRKSESQVGIHPVLPSPPSDVFVLGLPYVRCLFFQRSSSRCVGFASGVPTAFAFELSKTVAFPRLLCTSEVPPNGPNPREVSLPWLSPWTFACVRGYPTPTTTPAPCSST